MFPSGGVVVRGWVEWDEERRRTGVMESALDWVSMHEARMRAIRSAVSVPEKRK